MRTTLQHYAANSLNPIDFIMSAQPVLLFLGAGPKLGTQIPPIFAEAGYKIVLVARSLQDGFQDNGYYHVKADFSDPTSIPEVFDKVKQNVGIPTVVVYNGAHPHPAVLVCPCIC